jgi:hypothetical protein
MGVALGARSAYADAGGPVEIAAECRVGPDQPKASHLRLSVLMDLYIHPLYVLVSKILSSILNSPAPIHPLYHPLSTLSTVGHTCHFI